LALLAPTIAGLLRPLFTMVYPCLSLSSTLGPATEPIILASGELITLEAVLRTSLALFCPAFTIAAPYSLRAALSFSSM